MRDIKLQEISLPCWIFSPDLQEIIGQNEAAQAWGTIMTSVSRNSEQILKDLDEEGLSHFGSPRIFVAYKANTEVYIQCLADMALDHEEKMDEAAYVHLQEYKRAQTQLRSHTAKLNAIFDTSGLFIFTVQADMKISSCNPRFEQQMYHWFGREVSRGAVLIEDPTPENEASWARFTKAVAYCLQGQKRTLELELLTKHQERVSVEIHMDVIDLKGEGNNEVSCIAIESTEKRQALSGLNQSLEQKEELLKELHHRVKNNLQIISSLLNMQCGEDADPQVRYIISRCQERLSAMSFIHEHLYMRSEIADIPMEDYLRSVLSHIVQVRGQSHAQVEVDMDVEELVLEIDQAIPCGLIINELVSNALDHAFVDQDQGQLDVKMSEREGKIHLRISDDGKGLPEGWKVDDKEHTGIALVHILIEQLDGEVEIDQEKGTEYLITFEKTNRSRKWQEPTYS